MTSQALCPEADRLRDLLEGRLTQSAQAELATHVETCGSCQQKLELLSGEATISPVIAKQLGRGCSIHDPALRQALDELKEEMGKGPPRPETLESEELSLEFLDPSEKPGHLGRLGHYEVTEVIGRGGMGVVLKAFDEKLHRVVGIKVMAPQLAVNASARRRFTREAQAAAAVSHDHIVTIYAVEEANGLPYLVMQYVAGESLQQRLDRGGPLQVQEILRIGLQAAGGLAAAHAQGLIHRDIKPANILLENSVERVKITDFGLARAVDDASLTQSGIVAGTPQYMAPEQARGEAVDHRADLFSLGSVLYAMASGQPPFHASGNMAVLKRVCEETPRPLQEINPEIPDWLNHIVSKLHAKDPRDRYQSAAEVAEFLSGHLAHLQQPALAPMSPVVEKRGVRSRRRRWLVAAVVVAIVLIGSAVTVPQIIIRITGKGGEVIEVKMPQGSKVEIEKDGQPVHRMTPPQGADEIHRFQDELGRIGRVAFSRDGSHALFSSYENAVYHVDMTTKLELHRFRQQSRAAYSPMEEKALMVNTQGVLSLWNLLTRKEERRLNDKAAGKPSFSSDGRRAICGCSDHSIRIWDLKTGEELKRLVGHQDSVEEVLFFPDGHHALSGSDDRTSRVWDLENRRELKRFEGIKGTVYAVAISPDGRHALCAGQDPSVRLWDVTSGDELRQFTHPAGAVVMSVCFSPDGRRVLTGEYGRSTSMMRLWETAIGKEIHRFPHGWTVRSVAFSPDGKLALSGSWDRTVRLWQLPPLEKGTSPQNP